MSSALKFRRILLKVSGESLMGNAPYGIDPGTVKRIAQDILEIHQKGIEISIVVGGGNIYRGISGAAAGMERASADYIGMLATVMNALAMQHALEEIGVTTRVLSAIPMETICEPYIRRRAVRHMERERLVIFAAGTGNPYFTTDTAAALRAAEMGCDALFKATKVDGVYSSDPEANPDAKKFKNLKYLDVISKDLKVMDASAISLARENNIPIVVFSILEMGGLGRIFNGEGDFTLINDG